MPWVTKCCCCCSLKYGYLAYGVICLVFRICAITTIFFAATAFGDSYYSRSSRYSPVQIMLGGYLGWFIATGVALFIALKGIVQKRSILLYPYIVVLIFEIIALLISSILKASLISESWLSVLLELLIVGSIDIYAAICLISLYQHMKDNEKNRLAPPETIGFKTV